MSDTITTFTELSQAAPGVEHYTETLAQLPDVQSRLRWVLDQVPKHHTVLGIEVPPQLLRQALSRIQQLERHYNSCAHVKRNLRIQEMRKVHSVCVVLGLAWMKFAGWSK